MTMTNVELVDALLADMGAIHRRAANETLSETDFRGLMERARWNAKALRDRLVDEDEPAIELTDKAMAVIAAGKVGRHLSLGGLMRRKPRVQTGRELAEDVARIRTVTDGERTVGVVDGGRP